MQSVEQFAQFIHNHRDEDHAKIREQLGGMPTADVAEVLNALPSLGEAAEMLTLVPLAKAIEVCDQPTLHRRAALVEQAEPPLAGPLLEGVSADQRADIVRGMSMHSRRLLLPLLSAEARSEVERLLQYPEDTAGDLMTTEFVRLEPTMTVSQAVAHIREVACERETIYACYIV
jgi:magnesium transporter